MEPSAGIGSDHETDLEAQARFEADCTRAIDDVPNLSAAGGQRLWRGHPAIEMVAKVPADDREGDGPMVKRDAGIDFEIIGLRKNIVDDVLVRILDRKSTRLNSSH